jgi:UrcA family protein
VKRAIRIGSWTLQGVLGIGLAVMGVFAVAPSASAQEVKIEASKVVTIKHQHSKTGIQQETVQLSHTVNFADLDLASATGASELKGRIQDTATQVCKQLGVFYPAGTPGNENTDRDACIKGAVDSAMGQASLAIASAQRGKQR